MKNNIIYISFLLFLSSLCSCSLEEAYTPVNTEGTVEFVPRLTNYNDVNVTTKADVDETAVYNSYLLLFNGEELISSAEDISSEGRAYSHKISTKILGSLSSVTACYIANVPKTFVDKIKTATDLNTAVLDLEYPENSIGIPLLDHDNDGKTPKVLAIPMFGKQDITNLSAGAKPQINVTRLFAKVTLNIRMDLKDIGTLGRQRNTFFELLSLQLCNIPKKVYLSAPDKESTDFTKYETLWDITKDYAEPSTQIANQIKIYNQAATAINVSKDYSFDCYVPEYFLLPINKEDSDLTDDQYGKQEYKPNLAGEKKAVYIKLRGNFDPAEGDAVGMVYDIYLGENSTTSFTLQRNKHYTNHVTITGIDNASAEVDNRVTITTEKDLINIYGEVANCYAISKEGEYTIKAYKGAYKYSQLKDAPKCIGTSVKIIAQDKAGVKFADKTPFVVSEEDGIKTIRFNVTEISADCNIVIAMMKDEAIEWSWHLWFIKDLSFSNQGFFELGTQDMPNTDKDKMVDRNLGVIREIDGDWIGGVATGFYYKYGHRAPYFEDKLNDNGKQYHGFNEKDYYTWEGAGKSPSDPCPPGYKVPSTDVWSGNATKEHANENFLVYRFTAFRYWNSGTPSMIGGGWDYLLDDVYYPYSGYIDSTPSSNSGTSLDASPTSFNADDYRDFEITFRTDDVYGNETIESILGIRYGNRTISYTEYKYSEFVYEIKLQSSHSGYLWGSDQSYFYYALKGNTNWEAFNIKQCKSQRRNVTRQQQQRYEYKNLGSFFRPNYQWVATGEWYELTSPTPDPWSDPETITSEAQNTLIDKGVTGNINNNTWKNSLRSQQANRSFALPIGEPISFTTLPSEGYQVRCVKE